MVYFYQDRLNGSPVEIAVTGSKIWTGILKSVISGTWGKKKNRWTKKYSRPAHSKKRYMCMTYIKIYRSINSGCKHCFSSYARIHFRLWFIRDFRDFSCSIIALGRGGKKIQERNFISTVYSNENASGSRYRYESIFSSTSARISRIPINVLRSFLSFFFAQQRNGGLETSNDIMCRLIFAFRSRKLGEREVEKSCFFPMTVQFPRFKGQSGGEKRAHPRITFTKGLEGGELEVSNHGRRGAWETKGKSSPSFLFLFHGRGHDSTKRVFNFRREKATGAERGGFPAGLCADNLEQNITTA